MKRIKDIYKIIIFFIVSIWFKITKDSTFYKYSVTWYKKEGFKIYRYSWTLSNAIHWGSHKPVVGSYNCFLLKEEVPFEGY